MEFVLEEVVLACPKQRSHDHPGRGEDDLGQRRARRRNLGIGDDARAQSAWPALDRRE
jgi:hypothetical protein